MTEKITEIERIRKKFKASRKQFGNVFLGKSATMVKYYEKGMSKIPQTVLMLAHTWENFLDSMTKNEEKEG